MTNRIHNLFKKKAKEVVSIYCTAGYPNLDDTMPLMKTLELTGADIIEIGIPFSDPLADGPIIQASSQRAIANGMSLKYLFHQLKNLRDIISIPVLLMGYLNPIMQYGERKFIEECIKIGIDGMIVPDMPINYYQKYLHDYCKQKHFSNILLVTPDTSIKRIRLIDQLSDGFIYLVSSNTITGKKNLLNRTMKGHTAYFERIKNLGLQNPTMVGFGIQNMDGFDFVTKYSSGAIIGSSFIEHITENGINLKAIEDFFIFH